MQNKLIQWKANSLKAHYKYFQKVIADEDPDILSCIQETNFKPDLEIKPSNFDTYYKNRINCLAASGGVAIYTKLSTHSTEVTITTELEAVAISEVIGSRQVSICNVYIPNS